MNSLRLALLAITATCALGIAQADEPAFNIIETRQAGQDLLSATYSGIHDGVSHKVPVKAFDKSAAAMARWMTQFPTTFPPGSDHGHKTRALPAIWSDRPGFEKAAANLVAAADKLAQLAKADDTAGFTAQTKVVEDACTACHNKFRAK